MYIFYGILIVAFLFTAYVLYENSHPILEDFYLDLGDFEEKLVVLHVSDLHNATFGKGQVRIKNLLKDEKADMIFITGDLVDRRRPDIKKALDFIDVLPKIPIYFVRGNHEKAVWDRFPELERELKNRNVKILKNETVNFSNHRFSLIGLDDPTICFEGRCRRPSNQEIIMENKLKDLREEAEYPTVFLLSHRPEFFPIYSNQAVSLVFSGHAHGGQIRVFNKALFSASQGFFAPYVGGLFKLKETYMINNRGLGNNFFWAKRVFNRPHIVKLRINEKFRKIF